MLLSTAEASIEFSPPCPTSGVMNNYDRGRSAVRRFLLTNRFCYFTEL